MDCSLLILSSDGYSDCWDIFFDLLNKNWSDCPYRTYLVTETKKCSYCETININNSSWSFRFKEALKMLETKNVIIMLEDYFIRTKVDQNRIDEAFDLLDDDTISFDFEKAYCKVIYDGTVGWAIKPNKAIYLNCTQAGIWDRLRLIDRIPDNQNPQQWETTVVDSVYKHYVNTGDFIIDYGYRQQRDGWGITRGKWAKEFVEWLKTTNYEIDIEKRGVFDGQLY